MPHCLKAAGVSAGDLKAQKLLMILVDICTNCSVKEKKLYTGVKVKPLLVRKYQVLIASAISYLFLFSVRNDNVQLSR